MGDDREDEELFLPLRLFYAGRSLTPRDRREWQHERAFAERLARHRGAGRGQARAPGRMRGLSRTARRGTGAAGAGRASRAGCAG